MDNQNQTQNPTMPVQEMPQAVPPPPPVAVPVPAPQSVQSQQVPAPPSSSGSKMLWIVLAVVVILLLVAGGYYYFSMSKNNESLSDYPTPTVMPQNGTETPTPTAIQSASDLNDALIQVDSTTPSATTELDRNTLDSTSFTP